MTSPEQAARTKAEAVISKCYVIYKGKRGFFDLVNQFTGAILSAREEGIEEGAKVVERFSIIGSTDRIPTSTKPPISVTEKEIAEAIRRLKGKA